MEAYLWEGHFTGYSVPKLPCPHCRGGKLRLKKESLQKTSPEYARHAENPDEIPERFTMLLECSNPACGEIVSVDPRMTKAVGNGALSF